MHPPPSPSLVQFFPGFITAGFDDISFIASLGGLSESDCNVIGIPAAAAGHRRKLFTLYGISRFVPRSDPALPARRRSGSGTSHSDHSAATDSDASGSRYSATESRGSSKDSVSGSSGSSESSDSDSVSDSGGSSVGSSSGYGSSRSGRASHELVPRHVVRMH